MWFTQLTGFDENDGAPVAPRLVEHGPYLVSAVTGRRMRRGTFTVVPLADLRVARDAARAARRGTPADAPRRTTAREVVGEIRALHADPATAGAVVQVASQFNMLEMAHPDAVPEDGVDVYELDPTQGPACAVACGAGTLHRNYLVPVPTATGTVRGQSARHQLDGLAPLAAALGVQVPLRNGYALPTPDQLAHVARVLADASGARRAALAGALALGVQTDTEVTWHDAGHTVTQVFCSALPVAYGTGAPELWQPFARLVLEAAYEATFAVAVATAARTGNRTLLLTALGGGAFGNPLPWVRDALERALHLHRDDGLDVRLVSHARPHPMWGPALAAWG